MAQSLILDEFDMTIVNKMDVDHGLTVPLSLIFGQVESWPCRVIPLAVNVIQYPPPTGHRCYNLGKVIRRAIELFEEGLNVVILGTGGLTVTPAPGHTRGADKPRLGQSLSGRVTRDPDGLARIPPIDYVREAGSEGIEMVMWLIMRGALDAKVDELYRFYHVQPPALP